MDKNNTDYTPDIGDNFNGTHALLVRFLLSW